jgi:coenzyme F420-reducing hydrogenase beta subunit
MAADENGFIHPVIDAERCVECGLCEKTCPVATPLTMAQSKPKAYAAYSKDEAVRMQSSSGGIFTEVAKAILANGGVVFGAAYNARFEVVHTCVDSEAELAKLRGAKYAQSDLRGIFAKVKAILDNGQQVLFSGTPCQVGGLKAYLRKDYVNLVTVDFVCHSVPSPMAWQEYVKYRAQQDNSGNLPQSIDLRSKTTGWSRYQYSNRFLYDDGSIHAAKSGESLYMKLFVGGYINRESCDNCRFKGYHRISDLTIGDFWGIWDIEPEMDDNKGTSVVLVQSDRGAELLQKLADRLAIRSVSLEEASRQNQAMLKVSAPATQRTDALARIKEGRIAECEQWFIEKKPPLGNRAKNKLKRLIRKIIN